MSWLPKAPLCEQFQQAREVLRESFPRWKLGTSAVGFFAARQRFLEELQDPMVQRLRGHVAQFQENWRVRGWLVFSVDGSRFETCRSRANEQVLGCAGKESTSPQVFQTTLLHVGTGLPWDFRLGPGTDSERRHLDQMLDSLPEHSLLTADTGFISFNLCRWLLEQKHSFVLRVGSNVHLLTRLGWELEVEGQTVYLWPQKQRHLAPVVLRLIVIQTPGHQPVYLVTNVLDVELLSAADAAEIYRLRWGQELYYRSFKQTLGHKTLQSRTPQMSLTEQTWHVIASWVLQLLTARQLIAAGKAPASWSAAKARSAARRLIVRASTGRTCRPQQTFRRELQAAILDDYIRNGPKQIRNWPRKKQETPPGPPKIRAATETEKQQAQRLRRSIVAML